MTSSEMTSSEMILSLIIWMKFVFFFLIGLCLTVFAIGGALILMYRGLKKMGIDLKQMV